MNALRTLTEAGLHVRAHGNRLIVAPADRITDPLRALIRQYKAELLNAARAARRNDIRARLLRWGWPECEAEATAARISMREADDDRSTCPECANYRPGHCASHRLAGLHSPDLGRDLAALRQRCPGFKPIAEP